MILLDTNVVSELMKEGADPRVERWYLLNEDECALTSITLAELSYGIARLADGARRRALEARLTEWRMRYSTRTVPFGASAAMRYGPMLAAATAAGRPMSLPDAQIAAIALDEQATVATRNIADFAPSAALLVNPWEV